MPDAMVRDMNPDENGRRPPFEEEEDDVWVDMAGQQVEIHEGLQPVLEAAEEGDVEALRDALRNWTGSIDAPGEDGDTALHLACLYGHKDCVEALLAAGASVAVRDEDGAVPLHDASAGGYTAIAGLLLAAARSPGEREELLTASDVDGDTPLHHAARGGHAEGVQLLLAAGASPAQRNQAGQEPHLLVEGEPHVRQLLEEALARSQYS